VKIAKFWAKEIGTASGNHGENYRLVSWSGSNQSLDDARRKALEKLARWKERLSSREHTLQDEYPYALDGEIREELIEEIFDRDRNLIGAITRNRYGALVLNAPRVMYIDVDLPPPPRKKRQGLLGRLFSFGKTRETGTSKPSAKEEYLQHFSNYQNEYPNLNIRVYETAAGFRLVVLNKLFDPLSEETKNIFNSLRADFLYSQLCRAQQCFRARLSPKPWRCGLRSPPHNFPREHQDFQTEFETWLNQYNNKTQTFAVCRKLQDLGSTEIDSTVENLLGIHDKYVLGDQGTPLA